MLFSVFEFIFDVRSLKAFSECDVYNNDIINLTIITDLYFVSIKSNLSAVI